jgi:hypothetical protein
VYWRHGASVESAAWAKAKPAVNMEMAIAAAIRQRFIIYSS